MLENTLCDPLAAADKEQQGDLSQNLSKSIRRNKKLEYKLHNQKAPAPRLSAELV